LSSDARPPVDYKTHMLIGVRPNGIMTVLADWPYVPRQAEVQEQIDVTPMRSCWRRRPQSCPGTTALLAEQIGSRDRPATGNLR
jgi:hypothetical protein